MRLLHPYTIKIIATKCTDDDFTNATVSRKSTIAHAWCEVLKFKGSGKSHPKMFIHDDYTLGCYMSYVKKYGDDVGCNLNVEHLLKYDEIYIGFCGGIWREFEHLFDEEYLFSDAVSLYLKGLNIFPYIYGNNWQKYCPIISLKEVKRIVDKTLKGDSEV